MHTNPTNETRADRAESALMDYIAAKGEVFEGSVSEAADLLADLMHWVASWHTEPLEGVAELLRLGRMHFDAEHENPEEM